MTIFPSEASDPFWWLFVLLSLGLAIKDYRRLRRLRAEKADLAVDGWIHSHADADEEWDRAYDRKIGAAKSGIGTYLILAIMPPIVWYVVPWVMNWIQ